MLELGESLRLGAALVHALPRARPAGRRALDAVVACLAAELLDGAGTPR